MKEDPKKPDMVRELRVRWDLVAAEDQRLRQIELPQLTTERGIRALYDALAHSADVPMRDSSGLIEMQARMRQGWQN
jgi:hypothetical protein